VKRLLCMHASAHRFCFFCYLVGFFSWYGYMLFSGVHTNCIYAQKPSIFFPAKRS
jgi:hypothetical protein